jgi:hypothetical protein
MNIEEYRTVRANSVADLDDNVNALLKQRFRLHGNPYAAVIDSKVEIYQAMVKEARGKTTLADVKI